MLNAYWTNWFSSSMKSDVCSINDIALVCGTAILLFINIKSSYLHSSSMSFRSFLSYCSSTNIYFSLFTFAYQNLPLNSSMSSSVTHVLRQSSCSTSHVLPFSICLPNAPLHHVYPSCPHCLSLYRAFFHFTVNTSFFSLFFWGGFFIPPFAFPFLLLFLLLRLLLLVSLLLLLLHPLSLASFLGKERDCEESSPVKDYKAECHNNFRDRSGNHASFPSSFPSNFKLCTLILRGFSEVVFILLNGLW